MKKIVPYQKIFPYLLKGKANPDTLIVNEDMGTLKKEQIEVIHNFIIHSPAISDRRMVLLLRLDLATIEFQNSLLKDLEDSGADFIMSADDLSLILPTIKSRCEVEKVQKLSVQEMKQYALEHDYPFTFDLYAYSGGYKEFYEGLMNSDPNVIEPITDAFKVLVTSKNPDALFKAFGLCPETAKNILDTNKSLMPLILNYFDTYAMTFLGLYPESRLTININTGKALATAVQHFKTRPNPGKGELFTFVREITGSFTLTL